MREIFLCIVSIVFFLSLGQAQKVSGVVYDSSTGNPLPECSVFAYYSDAFNVAKITDSEGKFSFDVLEGNCVISTSFIGYKKYKKEFFVSQGEEVILDIHLTVDTLSFLAPVITSSVIKNPQELEMTKDVFLRLPGAFNDPSRLLTRFPTIAITNDQANQITIKGLAPHVTSWYINNAPIINPNHLSNAGTITDQASSSGGGVNMISGSSINTFSFLSAPISHRFYDSPAGLSNFTLGIPQGLSYSIGLLGTQASWAKEFNSNSVGINYRYSTLGILSAMGVNLGDEEIAFQDVHLSFGKDIGKHNISFDVIAGNSKNDHAALEESEHIIYKDAQDIRFKGRQFLSSLHHTLINNKWSFANTLNYSFRNSSRSASIDSSFNLPYFPTTESTIEENNLSMGNLFTYVKNDFLSYKFDNQSTYRTIGNTELSDSYFQQYNMASASYKYNGFNLSGGLGFSHFPNKLLNPELRFSTAYNALEHNIVFKYSKQSNSILAELYLLDNTLQPFISDNFSLDYFYKKSKSFFQAGIFYNSFSSVPVSSTNFISYFDRIDLFSQELQNGLIGQNGTAKIVGVQEQFEYLFLEKIQIIQALSLYDINVQEDGRNISSTYDFGYTYAFTLSTNNVLKNSSKLLYSISLQGRGAGNELIVDNEGSVNQNSTIYFRNSNKKTILDPYIRVDAKIDYIFGKNLRHRLSLDIQNVLNRQNDAYQYYDPLTKMTETQNQLGLIPVLKFSSKIY